ncbi:MrcB family domain-containing protein [Lacticaseibacillus saniviri]
MRDNLNQFMKNLQNGLTKPNNLEENPTVRLFRQDIRAEFTSFLANESQYHVKASTGVNGQVMAEVPWLGIFDTRYIQSASGHYFYPVYLFSSDGKGFYLSINQSWTNINDANLKDNDGKKIKPATVALKAAELLREYINPEALGHYITQPLDLRGTTALVKGYEVVNVIAKYYAFDQFTDEQLKTDLRELLTIYKRMTEKLSVAGYAQLLQQFQDWITESVALDENKKQLSTVKSLKYHRIANHSNQQLDTAYISEEHANYIVSDQELEQQLQRQKVIGSQAEILAFKYYCDKTNEIVKNRENAAEILDKLQYRGQDHGFGYDIQALDLSDLKKGIETEIHVEVKATGNRHGNIPFYMSRNEIQQAMMDRDTYRIFRIYDFNAEAPKFDELRVFNDESQINEMKRLDQLIQSSANVVPMTYLITEWQSR